MNRFFAKESIRVGICEDPDPFLCHRKNFYRTPILKNEAYKYANVVSRLSDKGDVLEDFVFAALFHRR